MNWHAINVDYNPNVRQRLCPVEEDKKSILFSPAERKTISGKTFH